VLFTKIRHEKILSIKRIGKSDSSNLKRAKFCFEYLRWLLSSILIPCHALKATIIERPKNGPMPKTRKKIPTIMHQNQQKVHI